MSTLFGIAPSAQLNAKKRSSDGQMVVRAEHPLHCGHRGKLYSRFDRVTPLIDSMSTTCQHVDKRTCLGLFPARGARACDDKEELEAARARQAAKRANAAARHFGCTRCERGTPYERNSESALVCCGCGVVLQQTSADEGQHRDKNCPEDQDKTVRADRVHEQRRDRFDGPPETAADAQRRRVLAQQTTMPGRDSNLLHVAHVVARDAARDSRSRAQAESGLLPRDEQKIRRILEAVEGLIRSLSPVEPMVQRRIRMAADAVFCKAARHAHCCAGVCEVRLTNRHAFIIACAVFELTVQEMTQLEAPGVDRQSLLELRNLMNRHVAFNNNASATQRNATKTSIQIMQDPSWAECVPCAKPEQPPSPTADAARASAAFEGASSAACGSASPAAVSTASSPRGPVATALDALPVDGMRRCDSSASNVSSVSTGEALDPPPLSECLEIRNAIGAVFAAHRSALPILAREGASRMLQMPAVKDVLRSERVFASLSHDAVAYGLLHAVTRAQYRHDADGAGGRAGAGPAARAPPLNQPIARRCGLSANDAEVVVDRLAALVPNDVSDASSDAGDDDLFA